MEAHEDLVQPFTSLVVVFCGPHDNDGQVSFRRIDAGIEGALHLKTPLMICGDGNGGLDCRLFEKRALEQGVRHVQALYDPRASTITDAESVAYNVRHAKGYSQIQRIYLTTDWWHMERAALFLARLLLAIVPERHFEIAQAPVPSMPPPEEQLVREKQGIRDFLADRYDWRSTRAAYGKPVPGVVLDGANLELVFP